MEELAAQAMLPSPAGCLIQASRTLTAALRAVPVHPRIVEVGLDRQVSNSSTMNLKIRYRSFVSPVALEHGGVPLS
jgi:hypothetical protein